jgi:outer membrane protein TolC
MAGVLWYVISYLHRKKEKIFMLKFYLLTILLIAPMSDIHASGLDLQTYIGQVMSSNNAFRGYREESSGAEGRQREKDVLLSPVFFASAVSQWDGKLPMLPLYTYDRLDSQSYAAGIMQQTKFGAQFKLSYQLDRTSFVHSSLAAMAQGAPLTFYDMRPVFEVSQPLWQNGFGRTVRYNIDLIDAGSKAEKYAADAHAKGLLIGAEQTYWKLVAVKEIVNIQKKALVQSQAIYDYVERRVKMNLGDKSDLLQAKAALESRKLELQMAENEEKTAIRAFNAMRNISSQDLGDDLALIPWEKFQDLVIPSSYKNRADVEAALAQSLASQANSKLAQEKDKPSFDIFGSVSLNGRDAYVGSAFSDSYKSARSTTMIGLKFTMPLNFSAVSEARLGALKQEQGDELIAKQKVFDQEQQWLDLQKTLLDAKEKLGLVKTIVETQRAKLENEKVRLKQGRTTTYQVLLFEQECLVSELNLTRAGTEILMLLAQLKLYNGEAI